MEGTARQGRTLRAFPGRWTPQREETRYRWLRDGEPIRGANERRYRLTALDVGARISVRVRVRAAGHAWTTADSARTRRVDHATPVRRRVTYSVTTRGRITTSVRDFARLAQETYDDARGWRAGGVQFRRVQRGGDFTLVLSEARLVPSFSSSCSATWSCRVGRFVIINLERWRHASPAWNAARREPARLPPPGGQPRDRPLARARARRLPGVGSGPGHDAAVQGDRRVLLQPVAAPPRALSAQAQSWPSSRSSASSTVPS